MVCASFSTSLSRSQAKSLVTLTAWQLQSWDLAALLQIWLSGQQVNHEHVALFDRSKFVAGHAKLYRSGVHISCSWRWLQKRASGGRLRFVVCLV